MSLNLTNETDTEPQRGVEDLLETALRSNDVDCTGTARITEINNQGLVTIQLPYNGQINLSELNESPVGNKFLYSSTKGDVEITSFDGNQLTVQVWKRA